jgi:integral membrane protein 2B
MYDDVIQNFLKQLMAQFNREMEDPLKEIRRMESKLGDDSLRNRFFREDIEFKDDDEDSFTDINIPDFRDGRRGRFIHDFKNNQTTIVDVDANRCFVYPLDYSVTLQPKSMLDAIIKMQSGYYFPDTNVLRKKMRVVTPELEKDDEYLSERTQNVCENMRVYKLEPFVSGVFKRSITVSDDHAKFAEFSGRKIVEFDFVNFDELLRYEEKLKN